MKRAWLGVALSLALGAPAHAAEADVDRYLLAAARLYENLEYERALDELAKARKLSRGADDDAAISLYQGIIYADLGKTEDSRASFKEGLFLLPDAKLPVKVSPKVEQQFEVYRVEVKKELAPILAKREEERRKAAEARRANDIVTPPPRKAPVESDRPVNPTSRTLVAQPVDVPAERTDLISQPPPRHGARVAPWVFLGGAAVAGGVGAALGVISQGDVNAAHNAAFESDADAHLRSAQGTALAANVLFVVAGAAALTAGGLWLFGGDD